MIFARIKNDVLYLTCESAESSADFARWSEQEDPIILFKEFYGSKMPEPCEYNTEEGGQFLSQTGYLTRQIGSSIWNKNVLHKGTKRG